VYSCTIRNELKDHDIRLKMFMKSCLMRREGKKKKKRRQREREKNIPSHSLSLSLLRI